MAAEGNGEMDSGGEALPTMPNPLHGITKLGFRIQVLEEHLDHQSYSGLHCTSTTPRTRTPQNRPQLFQLTEYT